MLSNTFCDGDSWGRGGGVYVVVTCPYAAQTSISILSIGPLYSKNRQQNNLIILASTLLFHG